MFKNHLNSTLIKLSEKEISDLEAWVINSTKINLLKKLENNLESKGIENLRSLLLVPIFKVEDMYLRVKNLAPELETIFCRELSDCLNELESKLCTV